MHQLTSSGALRQSLEEILVAYEGWQEEQRRIVGFNLAGLGIMGIEARESESASGWLEDGVEEEREEVGKGRKKRAFANMA